MRRLQLLGPARVDQNQTTHSGAPEAVVAIPRFRSRRTVGLLGYLATEGRPVARDLLAALFWPDETSSKGRSNLSRELHNLARILPDCWAFNRQSVAFTPSVKTTVDLYQLRRLEKQERWAEAAELLGGEFLEGVTLDHNPVFENWLLGERERWRGRAETVLTHLIEGHTRRGKYSDALRQARRLLQLVPWDEGTHRQIMRLSAWTGQRGAALRQFESCKRALREQLDVDPDLETIDLYHQIQAGKLDLPPQLPAFLTEEKARHPFERPRFVGRESELAQLDAFIDGALDGQGRVVFVTGGPGRGKTALLDDFTQRAMERHPELLVAGGKCNAYSGLGDPYLPYREVMAMLTGDVEGRWDAGAISTNHARRLWATFSLVVQVLLDHGPHLLDVFVPGGALLSRASAAGEVYAPWLPRLREQVQRDWGRSTELEQSHLFQQATDVLAFVAQERPLLLILDDIQWADVASITLLFHLGRHLANANSKLLIACAYRPEEVALGHNGERHPLAKVMSEFKRTFGDVWVHLGQAEEVEERRFMDALLDSEPNKLGDGFRDALFDRTGSHPLFTLELLEAMQERGDLLKDGDGAWIEGHTLDWGMLPARVEAVIEDRIDRLDPELQDILAIASVEGEHFTAQVVAEVRNAPERSTLRRLSGDLERRHRLVREQDEVYTGRRRLSRYRFGHVLFQDYLYKRLPQGERRLLHWEVAGAMETLYQGQLDEMAVQLAHHFGHAGDHGQAFYYFALAGERAAHLFASGEAINHYTRAIQLAEKVHLDVVSLAGLYQGRGQACETVGDFEGARADYETALKFARDAGEQQVEWRALLDLGKLWRSRDYHHAWDCFETALELARRADDLAVLAQSLNWMGNWYANDEKPQRAVAYHQEALKIVEQWGDRQELANTLDLLGIANLLGGDLNSSIHYYNRAIPLFRELDERIRIASSLIGRATLISALVWLGLVPVIPSPNAPNDFKEALRIAGEIGSTQDQAWVYWSSGLFHMVQGRFGRALEDSKNALRIASEIEHREYVVASRNSLGNCYVELFALEQAREHHEESLNLAETLHSATMINLCGGSLANAYLMSDDLRSAQVCLERMISPETPMDTVSKRYCWIRRAELALAKDDPPLALDITDRLIASAPGISPGRVITYLWKLKGDALAMMGQTEQACLLYHAAIENAEATGERFLLWRLHAGLGQLYRAVGHLEVAEKEYSTARSLIDELATSVPDETLKDGFRQGTDRVLGKPS